MREDYQENSPREQDRVHELLGLFGEHGRVVYWEPLPIYEWLAPRLVGKRVLEFGCGIGLGSALLERAGAQVLATDSVERNIRMARTLYPWIDFEVFDLCEEWDGDKVFDVVVALEVLEHVGDYRQGIKNILGSGKEAWFSCPNGAHPSMRSPPENPFHVREFTIDEVMEISDGIGGRFRVFDGRTFKRVSLKEEGSACILYHFAR